MTTVSYLLGSPLTYILICIYGGYRICRGLHYRFSSLPYQCPCHGHQPVHFLVMTRLALPVLIYIFANDVMVSGNRVFWLWGFLVVVVYLYLLIHFYDTKLLLPVVGSVVARHVFRIGCQLEGSFHREQWGCVLMALLALTMLVLVGLHGTAMWHRVIGFLLFVPYHILRTIVCCETASVYAQAIDPSGKFRSIVTGFEREEKVYIGMFCAILFLGVLGVIFVGVFNTDEAYSGKNFFQKGCLKIRALFSV